MGTIAGRLEQLKKRHASLDEKVHDLERSPGSCGLEIQALKKQKLDIKDEIARLEDQDVDGLRTQLDAAQSGGRRVTSADACDRLKAEIAAAQGKVLEFRRSGADDFLPLGEIVEQLARRSAGN